MKFDKPTVFIQANDKQFIGAKIAEFSLKENSKRPDDFDVFIMNLSDYPVLNNREGQKYLRMGKEATFSHKKLQTFTLLRFLPPQLMNYQGKAIVIDPDVFAVDGTDIMDLFEQDMKSKAVLCHQPPEKNIGGRYYKTSVMLLDCAKLKHWKWDQMIEDMFNFKVDYAHWMRLTSEDPANIGPLDGVWNHHDTLNSDTKLIHYTNRLTQPWKAGLKIDYQHERMNPYFGIIPREIFNPVRRLLKRKNFETHFHDNPSVPQRKFFFTLVKKLADKNPEAHQLIRSEMAKKNIRADFEDVLATY